MHLDRRHDRAWSSLGEVPVVASPVVEYFEGELDPDADRGRRLVARGAPAHGRTPTRRAGCGVRANADTPEDAARARRFGARGHRPVPHRAHVPRRAPRARRAADPGRATTSSAGQALDELLPLQREDFWRSSGDGRPAGHGAAARPAAARVPARPHRAVGPGRGRRGARRGQRDTTCACCTPCSAARAEPDARPARGPARPGRPRACSRCRSARSPRPPRELPKAGGDPQPEIMVPLVGASGAGDHRDGGRADRWPRSPSETGVERPLADRHDDRAAAGRADRRRDRRGGRVLLLRHQRPHPDDAGVLPRRRRGRVLLRATWSSASSASPRSRPSTDGVGRLVRIAVAEGPARPARTSSSASAASTAATPTRSTSSTTSASTTSPARRSASRSPGSRPAGPPLERQRLRHPLTVPRHERIPSNRTSTTSASPHFATERHAQ